MLTEQKEKVFKPPPANLNAGKLPVTCGDCIFFSSSRLPDAPSPCGVGAKAVEQNRIACLKIVPDIKAKTTRALVRDKEIFKALGTVDVAGLPALALAVAQSHSLRTKGYKLGERVAFNVFGIASGRDFVANYFAANIMYVDENEIAFLIGKKGFTAQIELKSVIKWSEFATKRNALVKKGKIFDKRAPFTWERKDAKHFTDPTYQPPWLKAGIESYRAEAKESKNKVLTHEYEEPKPRSRGRPRKTNLAIARQAIAS